MHRFLFLVVFIASIVIGSAEVQTFLHNFPPEDQLHAATEAWLQADTLDTSCSKCISLLQLVKNLSFMSEGLWISTISKMCGRIKEVDQDVCRGVIKEQAPVFRKVLKTMTVSGRDGHLLCAAVMNSCPYPEVEPWNVTFPKPKPDHVVSPVSVGKTFDVLHLSDWHVDPEYEPGAEAQCSKPICCRAESTDYTNITSPASLWGEYSCDTPLTLIESLLEHIPQVAPKLEFGLLTGDLPPHEVWSTLPAIKTQLIQEASYALLHAHFDSPHLVNTILYPAIGNHEAAPTNIFPLRSSQIPIEEDRQYLTLKWLYRSLAESWSGWLSRHVTPKLELNSGSYVTRPTPGLKLISLNTNFCYTMNWWLYEHPIEKDPNGILKWLIQQLQDSEDIGERVWIIGHISPGDSTCFHDYSNYYNQIVQRYAPHVIAGQFFGHTHHDEFQMFYRDGSQKANDAISVAYIGPSMTPFANVNPGFRIYKVDTVTFEVVDTLTYIADLDKAKDWTSGPHWRLEYTAKDAYNTSYSPIYGSATPLTPAWWHNVTVAMENDPSVFDKYWNFRVKSAPFVRQCEDDCQYTAVCNIRAGNSEQRCDYESDLFPGTMGHQRSYKHAEESACGLFLKGHRQKN